MSFKFNWPHFSDDMYAMVRLELTSALNSGERHPSLADDIQATEVFFGTVPPKLEILEISDMAEDRFKAIFKLRYDGDAYIVLSTKVQANPVGPKTGQTARSGRLRTGILAANKPLIVPIRVRVSALRLDGIAVLDMHRTRGVSLSFKNDPFKGIKVNTSFDENPTIAEMLQSSLESELRELFTTGIPELVHKLSLQHLEDERRLGHVKHLKVAQKKKARATAKSMPSSPELRRQTSAPGRKPPLSMRLMRSDSQPHHDGNVVGAQLATHSHQQATLSPFSVAEEHVAHRASTLATATPVESAPQPDTSHHHYGDTRKDLSFLPSPMLASPHLSLQSHLARPPSPLIQRRTVPSAPTTPAKPTTTTAQDTATIVARTESGEEERRFELAIPSFNTTNVLAFWAERDNNVSHRIRENLMGMGQLPTFDTQTKSGSSSNNNKDEDHTAARRESLD